MSAEEEEVEIRTTEIPEITESSQMAKCELQCMHHGDRACYGDDAAKQVVKKIPEESIQSTSSASIEGNSLHSGESLFKTFSFEAHEDDPDMEKCMAFWKSILSKNVKPMKCTLIKTKEGKVKKGRAKEKASDGEQAEGMWLNVYKDLQRRKLDKLKLIKNKKCEPYVDFSDEEYEKKQDAQTIINLNEWQPQKEPSRSKIDIKSQVARTLQVLKAARSSQDNLGRNVQKQPSLKKASQLQEEANSTHNKIDVKNTAIPEEPPGEPAIQEQTPGLAQNEEEPVKHEVQNNINETQETIIKKKEGGICSNCGCDIGDCICDEMGDCLGYSDEREKKELAECYPCDCSSDCICENHIQLGDVKTCSCGCSEKECICANLESCTCGCGVEECTCRSLEKSIKCTCGCGVTECMCQQLFTKSCKCGHSDCDCDMIKTLNAYLESLETSEQVQFRGKKVISEQCQTDEGKPCATASAQQTRYCIICGHFNCHCDEPK